MRKFKLQNSVGAEWDLMDKTAYFNAPGGLGFGKTYSTIQAGSAWLVSDEFLNQYAVTGEILRLCTVSGVYFVCDKRPALPDVFPAGHMVQNQVRSAVCG